MPKKSKGTEDGSEGVLTISRNKVRNQTNMKATDTAVDDQLEEYQADEDEEEVEVLLLQ